MQNIIPAGSLIRITFSPYVLSLRKKQIILLLQDIPMNTTRMRYFAKGSILTRNGILDIPISLFKDEFEILC
jgi:peptidyl-tRNA hydrolase